MSKKKTHEEFVQQVYKLVGNDYEVLSKYDGKEKYILVKHNICGNEYKVKAGNFLNGRRCPVCSIKNKSAKSSIGLNGFKERVYNLTGNEYEVIGEYKNAKTKVKMKHIKCGNEFFITPNNFLYNNARCPICAYKKRAKTHIGDYKKYVDYVKSFKSEILTLDDKPITEDTWKGVSYKYKFKCIKCGEFSEKTFYNFKNLNQKTCWKCNESVGNKFVREYLEYKNINFDREHSFENLYHKKKLRFDFAILNENNDLLGLIEYDGSIHYINQDFSRDDLNDIKERDYLKDKYCQDNNIPLLRIPYTEFDNITHIIDNFLKTLKC